MAVIRFSFFSKILVGTVTTSSGAGVIAVSPYSNLVALPDGGYLVAFSGSRPTSPTPDSNVRVQRMDATGQRVGGEIFVATDSLSVKANATIAIAADGTIAVAWLDNASTANPIVRVQILDRNFALIGTAQTIPFSTALEAGGILRLSIAAMPDGQFVIAASANATTIARSMFNPTTGRATTLDQFSGAHSLLYSGPDTIVTSTGRAITVVSRPSQVSGSTELYDVVNQRAVAEAIGPGATTGIFNDSQDIIALRDGGYAMAWRDNGYGQSDDISLKVFNADGTARSSRVFVNSGFAAGRQFSPSIVEMQNGYLVVSWLDGPYVLAAVFTAGGQRIETPSVVWSGTVQTPESIVLADGTIAFIWTAGLDIQSRVVNLVRETQSSDQSEDLSGDGLTDFMLGAGGNDTLRGLGGDDVLAGDWGEDRLEGGDGSDTLLGGSGLDTLDGGNGIDTASYISASGSVGADLESASANSGEAFGDVYIGIENLAGSEFSDVLRGNINANLLSGDLGDDSVFGNGGDDTLNGGLGLDILDGGAGFDFATYADAGTGLTLFMGGGTFNTGDARGDTHTSIEGLIGSQFSDIIGGDAGINELRGQGGNDFIYGRAGIDTLLGGDGNDVLSGGLDGDRLDGSAGIDVAFYRDAAVGLTASLLSGGTAGEAMGDTYLNIENIWGSDFDDVLTGDNGGGQVYGFAGNDNLSGLDGDDFFYGSVGLDTMTGGSGVDNFFFLSWNDHFNQFGTLEAYEGGDTFTDFTVGTDRIILSRYWFGFGNIQGPAAALTDTHANFVTNGTPTSARPSLIWNAGNRTLSFDADGNGATQAVLLGTFQAGAALTLNDIWTA